MSDTSKPPDIGHWLVATIAMWSDSIVKQDCIEMLVKTVKYADLEDARSVISDHHEKFPVMKIPAVQSGINILTYQTMYKDDNQVAQMSKSKK